jgi:putative membrane protein insertion efficiency factor
MQTSCKPAQPYPICLSELVSLLKPMTLEHLPSDYSSEPRLRDLPRTIGNWPRLALLGLIRFYQMTLSRTLPPDTCRFYPSCSHYGYQAVYKYGVFKGGIKAAWRVLRCNPFNPGGYDPVL